MVLLRCKFCGHVWNYQGQSNYATCPICHHKVNVQKYAIISIDEQEIDAWLIEQLKKAEQKLPEDYKPKIQWAIETLSTQAPAMQKTAARMFALSVIKSAE